LVLISIVAFTRKHLSGALESGHKLCHYFRTKYWHATPNYYEKMIAYVDILWSQTPALDPKITPKTFPVLKDNDKDSVFHYTDSASGRAGITTVTTKLSNNKVVIIGLGGTGAYILDLLAKTPVQEIHLYDGDDFLQHNAFRAPGAAFIDDLNMHSKKVDYYTSIYSHMQKGIIPHSHYLDESNVDDLSKMEFAFLCLDHGQTKRTIVNRHMELNIPFIECGIGIYRDERKLAGIVRVTTSTTCKNDHVLRCVMENDEGDNEYANNIQVAELNALNAVFAVIKWKSALEWVKSSWVTETKLRVLVHRRALRICTPD
jgi:tRNA A37 threonylcarbamoyladenosine dehydratase